MTIGFFHPLDGFKASSEGEKNFQLRIRKDPPDPMYKIHGVFSNKKLLSDSVRQSKGTATAYILGVPWTIIINNSKGFFFLAWSEDFC